MQQIGPPARPEGVTTSFDEFVEDRLDGLLRYATVLTDDPHLAQDIVQEVLLRAQQHWAKIDSPPTYVRRMVTNEYLSWRRRAVRRVVPSSHEVLDALSPPEADPSAAYDARDEMLALLATLPRKQRAAIVLRYYEGYSDAEIGEVLRCGASTVRSQISRALATLRTCVRPLPTVLTTGAGE
jgi:RNA polymerase sigma-70 factor (sigma-E family)